jgi:hypothetical protein
VTSIAPLPEYHDAVSAAALDGNIYVVASIKLFPWDQEGRLQLDQGRMAMLRYDEAKDEWRTLSPPTTYHGDHRACAAALDCKIDLRALRVEPVFEDRACGAKEDECGIVRLAHVPVDPRVRLVVRDFSRPSPQTAVSVTECGSLLDLT